MHPRNQERLLELWNGVWRRRRDGSVGLVDRFEQAILTGLDSGMFVEVDPYFADRFVGDIGGPGYAYGRRGRASWDVRVRITEEYAGNANCLRVEVECSALDRRPYLLMQMADDQSTLRRSALREYTDGVRLSYGDTFMDFKKETQKCACGVEYSASWLGSDRCEACNTKAAGLDKLIAITKVIANCVALRWALVWAMGRPVQTRTTSYMSCPTHGILLGMVCVKCKERRETLEQAMKVFYDLAIFAGWCRWQDVDDSEKRFMQLDLEPSKVDVIDIRTDADERFALLDLSGTPEPVKVRPPPKPYVRPPSAPRAPEPEPKDELLLELW